MYLLIYNPLRPPVSCLKPGPSLKDLRAEIVLLQERLIALEVGIWGKVTISPLGKIILKQEERLCLGSYVPSAVGRTAGLR